MLPNLLSQLLLATSLINLFPVDGAALAWQAASVATDAASYAGPAPINFASSWFATLPLAADRLAPPIKIDLDSYGIVTTAASAIVIDDASGAILYSEEPDAVRAIGSITKLMTVLVFLDSNPNLNQRVTIVGNDFVGGGRVYLRFDDAVTMRDVLRASLVGSDNTATSALSRFSNLSPEDFLLAMNKKAADLGMASTHYVDVSGVDSGNVSTARDLTKILSTAASNPIMAGIMKNSQVTVTQASGYSVDIIATDELLTSYLNQGDYQVVAGKTGYIPEAGYCFATLIKHDGHALRVVVLGSTSKTSRFNDAKGLTAWAFKTYSWK
jgi:D-alanyl-D-alanine endopeptidase (penicillin-binding protein 7)